MAPVHAHKTDGAVYNVARAQGQRFLQKLSELFRCHFARSKLKLSMPDATATSSVTVNSDVIPRVKECHVGLFLPHQQRECLRVASVVHKQAMRPK